MKESKNFINNIIYTLLTKLGLIFLKGALSIFTARLLGPFGKGLFFICTSLVGTLTNVVNLSMGEGVTFYLSKEKLDSREILGTIFLLTSIFSLFSIILLVLLLPLIQGNILSGIDSSLFKYLIWMVPCFILEYIQSFALRGVQRFKLQNNLSIITRIMILFVLGSYIFINSSDLESFLRGYLIGLSMVSMIQLFVLWHISSYTFFIPFKKIIMILKYGVKVHLGALLNDIEYRFDIFLLAYFLDPSALGVYSVGIVVAQILWYSSNSVNSVFFPVLSSPENEKEKDLFTVKVAKVSLFINAAAIFGLILVGKQLITILYGEVFVEAYFVFLFLSLGLFGDTLSRTLSVWVKSTQDPLLLSKVSLFSVTVNIVLNLILIPIYGIYGAAISSSASYLLRALVLMIIFINRSENIRVTDFFMVSREELRSFLDQISTAIRSRKA